MLIRAAIADDIPQMMRLAGESEYAAHWSVREYDALFAREAPERLALVAFEHSQPGGVAGFVIARCGSEWEIENVVVDPKRRRQGAGRLLILELMRQAQERGANDIFLEVRGSNTAARGLYAKLGFKEHGRRRDYYHAPDEDAVALRLEL